jgi:hypothetical protein
MTALAWPLVALVATAAATWLGRTWLSDRRTASVMRGELNSLTAQVEDVRDSLHTLSDRYGNAIQRQELALEQLKELPDRLGRLEFREGVPS